MESQTYIKNVKVTPRKLRNLLPAIKSMKPAAVLEQLIYTQKKGAKAFYKAIQSAISNAKSTLKVDQDNLKFKTLLVEEGQRLKRFRAGGRGTARPYMRRFSHIKIILEAEKGAPKLEEQTKTLSSKSETLNKSKNKKIKNSKESK